MAIAIWMTAREMVAHGVTGRWTTVQSFMHELKAHGWTAERHRDVIWRWTDEGTVMEFHRARVGLWLRLVDVIRWFSASGVPLSTEWLTARELAGLEIPGWPKTPQGVTARMKRNGWHAPGTRARLQRPRGATTPGGGGIEYSVAQLPDADREAVRTALQALMDRALTDFDTAA